MPLFLYGLAWTQLRHILLMRRASAYIAEAIAPQVRRILDEMSPENATGMAHVLNWEEEWQSLGRRRGGLWLLPVLGANYGLPLLAAVLSLVAYGFSVPDVRLVGWVLIGVNTLALIYSLVLGWAVEFRRFGVG